MLQMMLQIELNNNKFNCMYLTKNKTTKKKIKDGDDDEDEDKEL